MTRLLSALVLPPEVTRFERAHLERMNRIALLFFAAHVPVFSAIAFFNGTGPFLAALVTAFGCLGPYLAMRTFANPRHTSLVFAVTAMFMGGVLVHFGRGIWTIELHFYFFVSLALLAVFGNPMVILTAALTVALHHLIGWFLSPESVFNYEAPLASVLVHALFVVLESVAACFVARSFFDNVIGLERIVGERTRALDEKHREMRLVFDHVNQGFLTTTSAGVVSSQFSRAVERWLGAPTSGQTVWAYFAQTDASFAQWLELGWALLIDDVLPRDVALSQLPSRLVKGANTFEVSYQPVERADGQLEQVLVLVSDITERLARERADAVQRETVSVFERLTRDRSGFLDFFSEAKDLVESIASEPCTLSAEDQLRAVHTLKGNCAIFGVTSVATALHQLETQVAERGGALTAHQRTSVSIAWNAAAARVLRFLDGGSNTSAIQLDEADFLAILHAIDVGAPKLEVLRLVASWKNERISSRLDRLAEHARLLATKLGKGDVTVSVDAGGLRLPRTRYAPLWASFVHLVRNAVDHGLEAPDERAKQHKGGARLTLSSKRLGGDLVLSVHDDGAGIDWDRVRQRALRLNLPATTQAQLVDALFTDGVSTRDEASDVSGRGVGLAAVRAAARSLGGDVRVTSELGRGATFSVVLPWPAETPPPTTRVAA